MRDGAREVSFTDASGTSDQYIEMIVDKATASEFLDEGFIETARCALIKVFDGGIEFELGASQSVGELR